MRPKLKGDRIRELFVSTLFSTCIVAIITKLISVQDLNSYLSLQRLTHSRFKFSSLFPIDETDEVPQGETIHVGMLMKNVAQPGEVSHRIKMQFVVLLRSILQNAQTRQHPIHFLILLDRPSQPFLQPILDKFIQRDVLSKGKRLNVSYDFFNVDTISNHFIESIERLKPYFTSVSSAAKKYTDSLFMVAPFYHMIFPYDKFVMLDVDLKFRIDISELFQHFNNFDEDQMIGVGNDLAPHYRIAFREYREKNTGTEIGEPGKFQGFNTGVVLYDFQKMRQNEEFNRYIDNKLNLTSQLADKYFYRSHLGDQCFFTLLGMEHPNWFYNLPCEFNFQLDVTMFRPETQDFFLSYHNCTEKPKIYHGNGGFDIPNDDDD